MKIFITLFLNIVLSILVVYAQDSKTPQAFNYTGFATDDNANGKGKEIKDRKISVKASILADSEPGTLLLYAETHYDVLTNHNGLFSIKVGEGAATFGAFVSIVWPGTDKHLLIEIDPYGGSSFQEMGIGQIGFSPLCPVWRR